MKGGWSIYFPCKNERENSQENSLSFSYSAAALTSESLRVADIGPHAESERRIQLEDFIDIHTVLIQPRTERPFDLVVLLTRFHLEDVGHARQRIGQPLGHVQNGSRGHVRV